MEDKKVVLITGGAKGIGEAIAKKFAKEGYNIVLNYRSTEPDVSALTEGGAEVFTFKADVSNFNEAEELVKAVKEKFGKIDVLVNNAGITKDTLIMRMSEKDFDDVIDTNLKGTFNMIKHSSRMMTKQKFGTIINMSSVVGVAGNIGQANYAASKAGVIGLTKTVAKELAAFGITCNAVAPGFIETDMTGKIPENLSSQIKERIPLKRFGNVSEVSDLVFFLAGSHYITGQVICIDGGMC